MRKKCVRHRQRVHSTGVPSADEQKRMGQIWNFVSVPNAQAIMNTVRTICILTNIGNNRCREPNLPSSHIIKRKNHEEGNTKLEDYQRFSGARPPMPGPFRPDDFPVAMGYVPWQRWHTVYDLEKALCTGTIFPELDKPFLGVRGGCR